MALLDLFLVLGVAALLILLVTQICVPMQLNTPLFPTFRKSTPMKDMVDKAEKELEEQTELERLNRQLDEINRRKAELEKK